jgi:hypothetical protein
MKRFVPRLAATTDWAHVALLENLPITDEKMRADLIAPHAGPDASVVINSATGDAFAMHVTAPRHTLVASSIPSWPGWHIRSDGRNVTPLRINGAFLGFLLPPGSHDVRVWYAPWSFRIGLAVSLLTVIALSYAATRIGEPRHASAAELR